MDNLTHTLVGAALGQAGLKRRTGLAMPALMISANLPDVDALGLFFGENLAWRRGWTHGPLALLILPPLLAFALLLFDRWQARRGTRPAARAPVHSGQLLLLSYAGALSHPLLDLMNTYGIRFLMPFSDRWFYGDVLFIVDPWIWLALGAGIWLSRRRELSCGANMAGPAVAALVAVTLYSGAMAAVGRATERRVAHQFRASGLGDPKEVLASPVFVDPFRRQVVVRTGDRYGFGEFRWFPGPRLTLDRTLVPTHMDQPAIGRAARQDKAVADFLYWSRYPFAIIRTLPGGSRVTIGDARFSNRADAGPFRVTTKVLDARADRSCGPDLVIAQSSPSSGRQAEDCPEKLESSGQE